MSTTPAHAPTPAPAVPVVVPADAPNHAPADSPVAGTQEHTVKKVKKVIDEAHAHDAAKDEGKAPEAHHATSHPKGAAGHSEDHPEGEEHAKDHPEEKTPPAPAPHPEEASHQKKVVNGGYPLWIEKKEGHGLKEVGKDAAKGVWTMASTPVAFPLKMAAGVTVGVLGGAYDVARWTKNKVYNAAVHTKNAAKWFWNRDTLYIPTVVGGVASVIAWPFKKLGSGAAFLWNHKTWPFKKAWEGTKWTGRKIKGIFTKKPVTPTPVPAATPATPPPATPAAAHTPAATPATPAATPTPAPHHH